MALTSCLSAHSAVPAPSTPTRAPVTTQLRAAAQPFVPRFTMPGPSAESTTEPTSTSEETSGADSTAESVGAPGQASVSEGLTGTSPEHSQPQGDERRSDATSLAALEGNQRQNAVDMHRQQQQQQEAMHWQQSQQQPEQQQQVTSEVLIQGLPAVLGSGVSPQQQPSMSTGPQQQRQQADGILPTLSVSTQSDAQSDSRPQQPPAAASVSAGLGGPAVVQLPPSWRQRAHQSPSDVISSDGPLPGQSTADSRPSAGPSAQQGGVTSIQSGSQAQGAAEPPQPPRWSTVAAAPRAVDSTQMGARQWYPPGSGSGPQKRQLASHSADTSVQVPSSGLLLSRAGASRERASTKELAESCA